MTLPNSYSGTKQKYFKLWNEAQKQSFDITLLRDKQELIVRELNKAKTQTLPYKKINNIDLDWVYLTQSDTIVLDYLSGGAIPTVPPLTVPATVLFQAWTINIKGLTFKEAINVKHSFLFRFGTGQILSNEEINFNDNQFFTTNFIQPESINDTTSNNFIFHFGVLLKNTDGLQEQLEGLQVKLLLTVYNTKQYQ